MKSTKLATYHNIKPPPPVLRGRAGEGVGHQKSRDRKYAHPAKKYKTPLNTFFLSVAQATDSTCNGCTAQTAAATHAPAISSLSKILHKITAPSACSRILSR